MFFRLASGKPENVPWAGVALAVADWVDNLGVYLILRSAGAETSP